MFICFNVGFGVLCVNGNIVFGSIDGVLEFFLNIEMFKIGDLYMIFSDFCIFY